MANGLRRASGPVHTNLTVTYIKSLTCACCIISQEFWDFFICLLCNLSKQEILYLILFCIMILLVMTSLIQRKLRHTCFQSLFWKEKCNTLFFQQKKFYKLILKGKQYCLMDPSLDSSIGSTSAKENGVRGFKSWQGRGFLFKISEFDK